MVKANKVIAMAKVEIYTTQWCPYCSAAKSLLAQKGVAYDEIDAEDPEVRSAMVRRANGRRTVPQIFIGERYVGGYDDLAKLDRSGELDTLLGSCQ